MADAMEHALDEIVSFHGSQKKDLSILVLGRFGFDGYTIGRSERFSFQKNGNRILSAKYPELKLTYMTAHASKGLGYDEVIIIDAQDGRYGFPAMIKDDPVLSLVIREDYSYDYAEERRLFYVALTRTRNHVWIIAPAEQPSIFVRELIRDYDNVRVEGSFQSTGAHADASQKRCPVCGYPLLPRFKPSIGLSLYLCTNEPELCGFMTNDLTGGRLCIQKCDCCRDGYLIVKRNRKTGQRFLGCTNYQKGSGGCRRVIGDIMPSQK